MENEMGGRGVTRSQMQNKQSGGDDMMSRENRMKMLKQHHMQTLWIYWLVVIFGCWLILSPLTFDYGINPASPSGGRSVWLSLDKRIWAMKWSDIISGTLLVIFGWRSLKPNRPVSVWICCFIGIWLSFAPLVLWSPSAAAYLNDTLVGVMLIGLTILIPGMPNMMMYMEMGPSTPPGWSYNPSSWPQRWIMIIAGFLGWVVSRYLSAYQLGYIDVSWDPFFGANAEKVLNSAMSHSFPVSDAGLGAFAYTFEFLMGWMGSPSRWRTMPWMVTFFGILVIPLGLVHIFLVISQPVMVGHWCTFCLLAAAIMLPMLPLEVDEVIAMFQFMKRRMKRGEGFWKLFWKGGTVDEGKDDQRSPEMMEFPDAKSAIFKSSILGMSFPWTLVISTLIGIWLMFSPAFFGAEIQTPTANINHLGGALIIVVSVICMGEVLRIGRYVNILLGITIAAGIWFTSNHSMALAVNDLIAGLLVIGLAIPRGPKTETYGEWDEFIR